jgi:hypothetical protein
VPAVVAAGTAVAATGVFVVAAWLGLGGLHPSTSPLAWPAANGGLIATMLLLAAPGLLPERSEES